MDLKKQNVLFLTRTMKLGGTENVVLQLCEILKPYLNKIIVCSCGGVNVSRLCEMGVMHYEIPDIASKKLRDIFRTSKKINKIIKDEKITIVHSHHRMAALYASLFVRENIIRIVNVHNTFHDKRRLTCLAYRQTSIIAVGEIVKNNLLDFYKIPESQITVIHNAIKPFDNQYVPLKEFVEAKTQGYLLIGNIGRLSEQKGMEYFIEAAAKVNDKYKRVKFYIIGDGEDIDKLKKIASEQLKEGILTFLGYRSDIQNIITQLDLVVLSSLWEGLPLTPIEAYSVGRTVIATAVDGTVEIIRDGIDGYLVEPRDSEALAEKIIYLIEHPQEKEIMEQASLERYRDKFSFDQLAKSYVDYYSKLTIKKGKKKWKVLRRIKKV